jgi:hypothetical protein
MQTMKTYGQENEFKNDQSTLDDILQKNTANGFAAEKIKNESSSSKINQSISKSDISSTKSERDSQEHSKEHSLNNNGGFNMSSDEISKANLSSSNYSGSSMISNDDSKREREREKEDSKTGLTPIKSEREREIRQRLSLR